MLLGTSWVIVPPRPIAGYVKDSSDAVVGPSKSDVSFGVETNAMMPTAVTVTVNLAQIGCIYVSSTVSCHLGLAPNLTYASRCVSKMRLLILYEQI